MERVQIPINGITTNSNYTEGDCYSLVNLRPKNGALHPVAPRKIKKLLSSVSYTENDYADRKEFFVHDFNNKKTWLFARPGLSFQNIIVDYGNVDNNNDFSESKGQFSINTSLGELNGSLLKIEQFGSIIAIVTDWNIYYAIRKDDDYELLGEFPEIPHIEFGTSDEIFSQEKTITLYFLNEYGKEITEDTARELTIGLLNSAALKLTESHGPYLFDACFVRYAFRLYDGSLIKHSPPILVMPRGMIERYRCLFLYSNPSTQYKNYVLLRGYKIHMQYDFSGMDKWKDIIKSIDVFISKPLGVTNPENMPKKILIKYGFFYFSTVEHVGKDTVKDIMERISEESNFYLIKSIELGHKTPYSNIIKPGGGYYIQPDIFPTGDSDQRTITTLENREFMDDGGFSHHKTGAKTCNTYNKRLHIGDINTTLFRGFNACYFDFIDKYNNSEGFYPAESYYWYIAVDIKISNSIHRVFSMCKGGSFRLSSFFSYPDVRAVKFYVYAKNIYNINLYSEIFSADLKPHKYLNIAYFFNESLKPIGSNSIDYQQLSFDNKESRIRSENVLKVSGLNNPFVFPDKNNYQIGNGAIMAIESVAIRISEGQFGQFPLYVFTSQGIYSMQVGTGESAYSHQSPPTSYEIPISPIVCSTPFGIVFATQRGICIISGQNVVLLTPQLQQPVNEIILNPEINKLTGEYVTKNVLLAFSQHSFYEYIKEIKNIIYNPHENELILCGSDTDFNYVLNIDNKAFYQSTEKLDVIVGNVFSDLFVIRPNSNKIEIIDYSKSETKETHVSLMTRPLLFGTTDFKRLERMNLRSTLLNVKSPPFGENPLIFNCFSIDGLRFAMLRGIPIKDGSYKDFDMGLFSRSTYRQFLFAFAGVIDEDSEIKYLDVEVEKEYNNTKMR